MAPKSSVIVTSSVAQVTKPNDSESFMLMHEVPEDDPRYGRPLDGPDRELFVPTRQFHPSFGSVVSALNPAAASLVSSATILPLRSDLV